MASSGVQSVLALEIEASPGETDSTCAPIDPRNEPCQSAVGSPAIHGELLKLGIAIGQTSVAKVYIWRGGEGHRHRAGGLPNPPPIDFVTDLRSQLDLHSHADRSHHAGNVLMKVRDLLRGIDYPLPEQEAVRDDLVAHIEQTIHEIEPGRLPAR